LKSPVRLTVKRISNETGNALLEGVSFAALAFGLVLSSGLSLFQVESDQLALNLLARNVTRDYLLDPHVPLESVLQKWQVINPEFRHRQVELAVNCEGDCSQGSILQIELFSNGLVSSSFGVLDG